MAKDFRADRIRIKAIVGTGSIASTKPHLGLLIYSSSIASDWRGNVTDSAILSNVGDDVWMFVSGAANPGLTRADGSSVLFGGDVVVSGTLWAERSVIEVSDTVVGDFKVPNKIIQGYTTDPTTGKALFLADPTTSNNGSSNGAGNISFKIVDGVAGAFAYPDDGSTNTDVFFHVSGSRGVKGTDDRGLALFDGDVFISGNFELSPESAFSLAGDFTIGGDLTVGGNDILGSAGNALSFGAVDPDVTITRGLKIGNDALTGSDGTVFLVHTGAGNTGIYGMLQVAGNEIKNSQWDTVLRFSEYSGTPGTIYGQGVGGKPGPLLGEVYITGSGVGYGAAELFIDGDRKQGVLNLSNINAGISSEDPLGVIKFGSNNGGSGRSDAAYIGARAKSTWSTVPDFNTAIEFWTRGTSDSGFGPPKLRATIENNPNVSDRIQLTISGNLKLADGLSPGGGSSFGSSVLSADDVVSFSVLDNGTVRFFEDAIIDSDVYIGGNLDVNGTLTTIDTVNLQVKDALIELASAGGGGSNNTNGGIAIASGSSINDVSLVFGRGSANDTWRAGIKDTVEGTITDVSDSEPVRVEMAGVSIPATAPGVGYLLITGSDNALGTVTHLTASTGNGLGRGGILFNPGPSYGTTFKNQINLDPGNQINAGDNPLMVTSDGNDLSFYAPAGSFQVRNVQSQLAGATPADDDTDLQIGIPTTKLRSERLGSTWFYGSQLFVSGTHINIIADRPADGGGGSYLNNIPAQSIVLSASSDEQAGGAVIILSSSQEYAGGPGSGFEGFISIGGNQADVDRDFTMLRHRDVRTLLSGAVGTTNSNTRGVTLVGGDLVVSGNTDFKGAVAIGSISSDNLTLASVSSNEPYLRFRDSTVQINRRTGDDALVFLDGDLGISKSLRDLASLSVTDNTDVFTISGGEPSYIKTTGSFSFDSDDQYTTAVNGGNSDTYFYVSGSIGSAVKSYRPASNLDRGTAVFGGDVHISGSIFTDNPQFYMTLHTAYNTPGYGYPVPFSGLMAGAGAVIDTDGSGIPVQVRGANAGNEHLLALTGSMAFAYPGSGDNVKIEMKTDNRLEFHNSAGEVFRMTGASGGQAVWFTGNNRIYFEDTSRYVYGVTQDSVKKLKLENTDSGGTVAVSTNSGRMEVTGSLYPGADNTYDLGSNDYRWANIYTGDLHLQNERGDWTVIEEEDFLTLRNNKNGKRYKLLMELMDEE